MEATTMTEAEAQAWGRFREARATLINEMRARGVPFQRVSELLSCDQGQVISIHHYCGPDGPFETDGVTRKR